MSKFTSKLKKFEGVKDQGKSFIDNIKAKAKNKQQLAKKEEITF